MILKDYKDLKSPQPGFSQDLFENNLSTDFPFLDILWAKRDYDMFDSDRILNLSFRSLFKGGLGENRFTNYE
jgi:hypothetical protein